MKQMEKFAMVKVGQRFPLTIKRLGINGEGVGFFKKTVVFVPGALPGEEIVAEVEKVHPKRIEARIQKFRQKSKDRVDAPCVYYDECGGCQLQHLAYDAQLREKRALLLQTLARYTEHDETFWDKLTRPMKGMDDPWSYRNKSQFQVKQVGRNVLAGLYAEQSHHLIDVERCIVQDPRLDEITRGVVEIVRDLQISIYDEKKGGEKGLRTIVVRVGMKSGDAQLTLVTKSGDLPKQDLLLKRVSARFPQVKSIVHNIQASKGSEVFGEQTQLLYGTRTIREEIKEIQYELSARAFFQLNPSQTKVLYEEVERMAQLTGKEKVVDAYSGVGTIGLWLAPHAGEIRGMEVIPDAVKDANKRVRAEGYSHVSYEVGTAEKVFPKWAKKGFKPDVVVVDPPRIGLDEEMINTLLKSAPKRIVYVSCNPATLAKNVSDLSQKYKVKEIQPVDMFPQTAHVECVALIELK